jgi:hypothetical protein
MRLPGMAGSVRGIAESDYRRPFEGQLQRIPSLSTSQMAKKRHLLHEAHSLRPTKGNLT